MKIIDFHTHVYPQKIAQKATENVIGFYGLKEGLGGMVGTSEVLIACGKEAGIENIDVYVAATGSDETNMLSCFLARRMGAQHTIARLPRMNVCL